MDKKVKKFGKGFPVPAIDRQVQFNVVCEDEEIAPSIDVVDMFRIQHEGDETDDNVCCRWRSDVSMLFHAEESIKKLGPEGFRYLSESRRTKTSSVQQLYDQMSDDDLLATVKSRHLQSPSELIAWSEQLSALASELESDVDVDPKDAPADPEPDVEPQPSE